MYAYIDSLFSGEKKAPVDNFSVYKRKKQFTYPQKYMITENRKCNGFKVCFYLPPKVWEWD